MKNFKLTEAHLKLLQRAYISESDIEWGSPMIDGKRPFGNGDLHQDVADILGLPYDDENESLRDYIDSVYAQLGTALQIVLRTQSFIPGDYESDDYRNNWVKK
jgi:hypothetical protein